MKLSLVVCAASIAFVATQGAAQSPSILLLSQAVEAALANDSLMEAARLGLERADNQAAGARADRMPKVRISETATVGNNPVFVFGSLLEQGRFAADNFSLPSLNNPDSTFNLRTTLSASAPVFDGKKTAARIAQATIGAEQAKRRLQGAEQRVRFEIVKGYFDVLIARAALDVTGESIRLAESDSARARNRLDAGMAVESDLLAVEVQLSEFIQERIQAEGALATALAILNISMGSPPDTRRDLAAYPVNRKFDVPGPDELTARALMGRADYHQAESGIEMADSRISEQRSEYLPEWNVFASIGLSGRSLWPGSTDYSVGAGVTFDIFDRGRTVRAGAARIDKRLAQTDRDRVADQIRIEVERVYQGYRVAEQQVAVAEAARSQATEVLRIVQNRYEAGLTTITDVLRAETSMFRTQMNVVVSRHRRYVSYAGVLLSIGELNDVKAFEP